MYIRSYVPYMNLNCFVNITVRLVNGSTEYEGRVEVYYNGEWGTVCDDGWDLNDAQVVCTQLGLGAPIAARDSAYYGEGSGPIWLDDLNCTSNESVIEDCSHNGWGIENCSHNEDVGIQCAVSNGNYFNNYVLHMIVYVHFFYTHCMYVCSSSC